MVVCRTSAILLPGRTQSGKDIERGDGCLLGTWPMPGEKKVDLERQQSGSWSTVSTGGWPGKGRTREGAVQDSS